MNRFISKYTEIPDDIRIRGIPGLAGLEAFRLNKKFLRGSRGQFFQKAPPGRRRQKVELTNGF